MVSEDLFVSTELIEVRYVFRNRTPADVRTSVYFPMPDDDLAPRDYADVAVSRDFATFIGGKAVKMAVELAPIGDLRAPRTSPTRAKWSTSRSRG